eukprot:TRINITY_DN4001_c0_g2_i1.p1 TRINITY_DN4001_c0_g2~~TRINITY_DN4001_c0_g2_i1.p1  ORF type:complete len:354 (+),score=100.38 TRINITY_DN4001_c0_g2_i1:84-1145(+)
MENKVKKSSSFFGSKSSKSNLTANPSQNGSPTTPSSTSTKKPAITPSSLSLVINECKYLKKFAQEYFQTITLQQLIRNLLSLSMEELDLSTSKSEKDSDDSLGGAISPSSSRLSPSYKEMYEVLKKSFDEIGQDYLELYTLLICLPTNKPKLERTTSSSSDRMSRPDKNKEVEKTNSNESGTAETSTEVKDDADDISSHSMTQKLVILKELFEYLNNKPDLFNELFTIISNTTKYSSLTSSTSGASTTTKVVEDHYANLAKPSGILKILADPKEFKIYESKIDDIIENLMGATEVKCEITYYPIFISHPESSSSSPPSSPSSPSSSSVMSNMIKTLKQTEQSIVYLSKRLNIN